MTLFFCTLNVFVNQVCAFTLEWERFFELAKGWVAQRVHGIEDAFDDDFRFFCVIEEKGCRRFVAMQQQQAGGA